MTGTWHAFLHFFYLDKANAAIHCAPVRFSPVTFRLAEELRDNGEFTGYELDEVLDHLGRYQEDKGR